jgi:hypothetical protein
VESSVAEPGAGRTLESSSVGRLLPAVMTAPQIRGGVVRGERQRPR